MPPVPNDIFTILKESGSAAAAVLFTLLILGAFLWRALKPLLTKLVEGHIEFMRAISAGLTKQTEALENQTAVMERLEERIEELAKKS